MEIGTFWRLIEGGRWEVLFLGVVVGEGIMRDGDVESVWLGIGD